ncbi:hypothetical protein [Enterobacter bugandensis]|nr:hypothetical protein [Enterobacter bugandensis]
MTGMRRLRSLPGQAN